MLTEKLYGEPEGYDVSAENIAEYVEDPEFLYSDDWRGFSFGLTSEVRDDMINERINFNKEPYGESGKGAGIFTGAAGGYSLGSHGLGYMLDIPGKITPPQSTSLMEVVEKLAPNLSDPNVGGMIIGAGLGMYFVGEKGEDAGRFVSGLLEDSYRNVHQKKFNDDFYGEVSQENWQEYRDELIEELDLEYADEILE